MFSKTILQGLPRAALLAGALVLGAAVAVPDTAPRAAQEVNVQNGYAVHGYDPVAYFTEGRPVEGRDAHTAEHNGATYRFASAEHREMFLADPAKYAPQYGGFCAFGVAMAGRKFDGDPNAWTIDGGKLYLNLNKTVQARFLEDVPGYIRGADNNWPIIAEVPDAALQAQPPAGLTTGPQ